RKSFKDGFRGISEITLQLGTFGYEPIPMHVRLQDGEAVVILECKRKRSMVCANISTNKTEDGPFCDSRAHDISRQSPERAQHDRPRSPHLPPFFEMFITAYRVLRGLRRRLFLHF